MMMYVVVVNNRRLESLKSCGRPLEESFFWYLVVECREVLSGLWCIIVVFRIVYRRSSPYLLLQKK